MTTTRRDFLKWSGVGALGTVVFVGCGIPEEELLIQSPATMPENMVSGLEAWYATSCAQCGAGEGVIVRIIEGRAIKIEGNSDHPVSRGKTSVRCQAGLQALYSPDRLSGPMKRAGERGSGEFTPITWDQALGELTASLQGQDPSSVTMITDPVRGTLGKVAHRFMNGYGGNHMALESMENTALRRVAMELFQQDQLPLFEIDKADYVLNFGADFLSTWLSPVQYSRAYGQFRQGRDHRGTLVQIEPRMSMTAANADKWHYINPGTEGLAALSIAYVLMSDSADRLDAAAVDAMTGGAGAQALSAFAPESVAGNTGLSADYIRKIAHDLAGSQHSLVIGGGSAAAHTNGLANMKAIYSLNILLDSINKDGGIKFNPSSPLGEEDATAVATFADWEDLRNRMSAGQVGALLVHGANPAYTLQSINFAGAASGVGTIVSFANSIDETAALADLILPDHTYLESWGDDVPNPGPGYQVVTLQQPVVFPFHQEGGRGTRAFGDVLLDLSRRLGSTGYNLPWPTMRDAVRASAQELQGLNRGSVRAADFEAFWISALQRGGWWDENAKGDQQTVSPPSLSELAGAPEFSGGMGEYPFYLIPFQSNSITDGRGANLPWLQAAPDPMTTAVWETWVEINQRRADELDIKEGDILDIQSPSGTIRALAYPTPASHPDVLSIPTGLGHTHYGNYEIGPDLSRTLVAKDRGSNVMSIVSPLKDGQTNALAWSATRVRINKTGEWIRLPKFEGAVPPQFEDGLFPIYGRGDGATH